MKKLAAAAISLVLAVGCAHANPEATVAQSPAVPDTPEFAAGKARMHSGHGLQRYNRADEVFLQPPDFFLYMLIRTYVNKKIVGAPGPYDYASTVVWVWAEKGHGTMPEAELAAAAGCKVPAAWALASSSIVVPKPGRQYDSIKYEYKTELHRESVLSEVPCDWHLFRQTF